MRHVVPTCLVALGFAAVTVAAQDTKITKETTIKGDDAKAVVVTGCVTGGPIAFTLTNGAAAVTARQKSSEPGAVGTSGVVSTYSLSPRDGVDLEAHVGHKVEVTGVMLAASKDDDDGEVEITERTRIERDDAPDEKSKTRTEVEAGRGAAPKLAVTSVKMVSSTCTP